MKTNINVEKVTAQDSQNNQSTIQFNNYSLPVLDIDYSQGMDKKVRDYCLDTLNQGEWVKTFAVTQALMGAKKRNQEEGVNMFTEPEDIYLLYEGYQDYAWHHMTPKMQKYIAQEGFFANICHNYVSFSEIADWFNADFEKYREINNEHTQSIWSKKW